MCVVCFRFPVATAVEALRSTCSFWLSLVDVLLLLLLRFDVSTEGGSASEGVLGFDLDRVAVVTVVE